LWTAYTQHIPLVSNVPSLLSYLPPLNTNDPISDDTILDSWQVGLNRPPIDTHHPAVRTHPVTGLKALNINNGFVTSFPELKKEESDKLLEFFRFHIHSADDHYVRWKWAVGSVAIWDNVSTRVLT
jgi:sulfonate dioxygenase